MSDQERTRPPLESDLDRWDRISNILGEVFGETEEQFDKWGQQDHPVVSPEDPTGIYLMERTYRSKEMQAKERFARGERSWALIEFEELMEACSERDAAKSRAEWVQVAAVAVSAIAAIDRGAGIGPEGPPMTDGSRSTATLALPGDEASVMASLRPRISDTALARMPDSHDWHHATPQAGLTCRRCMLAHKFWSGEACPGRGAA